MFTKRTNKPDVQEKQTATQQPDINCKKEQLDKMLGSSRKLALSLQKQIVSASNVITHTNLERESLQKFDQHLQQTAKSLNDINSAVQEINTVIINQKQAAVDSSQAVEHIQNSVTKVADIVNQRASVAKELSVSAADSSEKVQQVLGVVETLSKNVSAITEVINSINNISEQTNLLAMNAAIEAVHAGKAGLGFSVVASEIRKLSENTRSNSANITTTLNTMVKTLDSVRTTAGAAGVSMKNINGKIIDAADSYAQISSDMQNIVQGGKAVLDTTVSSASAATQMSQRAADIATRINSIDQDMQHIQQLSEVLNTKANEIAGASADQVFNMNEIINCADEIESNARTGLTGKTFPYTGIVLKHLRWVARVRAVIDGKLNGQEIVLGDHHSCDLGKWIDTESSAAERALPEYGQLNSEHEQLHSLVRKIFEEKGKVDIDTLEKDYNQLLEISGRVIALLTKLRDKINTNSK